MTRRRRPQRPLDSCPCPIPTAAQSRRRIFSNNAPMTSSSSSSSSVARGGCTPPNLRTGELGSSPSFHGLGWRPCQARTRRLFRYQRTRQRLCLCWHLAPPKTDPTHQSIDPSPPRFEEARSKLRPWFGLVRARPTSTLAPRLWSTSSCSGMTKPSMGPSGWLWVPAVRNSGGGECGGASPTTTACVSALSSSPAGTGPSPRSIEISSLRSRSKLVSCRSSGSVAVAGAGLVVVAQAPVSEVGVGSAAAGEVARKPCTPTAAPS
ncbi:hypothetical protein EDB83DRAFT_437135 [Lactarius deliciosus]|nr:hypothetical protein EDB83DRAFT_437135 [Lactarius deliciosus]